jgi:hypothetical protein
MANPKTPGDLFFEKYCDLNGYFWTYEPALGSPGPLDYLIDRAGDRAVVEVKHFTTTRQRQKLMAAPGQAMYMESTVGKLQSAIRLGGDQLSPCSGLNLPLVVLLTTPVPTDVDLDPDDVVAALLGKTTHVFDLERAGLEQTVYGCEDAAVLHRDSAGGTFNRLRTFPRSSRCTACRSSRELTCTTFPGSTDSPARRFPARCSTPTTTGGSDSWPATVSADCRTCDFS